MLTLLSKHKLYVNELGFPATQDVPINTQIEYADKSKLGIGLQIKP